MSSAPLPPVVDANAILARARATFDIESDAVLGLKSRVGPSFVDAVRKILEVRGRVVVINPDPTELDDAADAVLTGTAAGLLPSLLED